MGANVFRDTGLVTMSRRGKYPRQSKWSVAVQRYADAGCHGVREFGSGLTVEEVMEEFSVTREPIKAVLHFAAQSLGAPFSPLCRQRPLMLILFDHGTPNGIAIRRAR